MSELYAGKPGRPPVTYSVIPGGEGTPIPEVPASVKNVDDWERLWRTGRAWLSNEAHYDLMRLLCEAIFDRNRIRRRVERRPLFQTGSGGQEQTHPGWRQVDALDAKIAKLLDQLGFSPVKRRTQVAQKSKNRLEALRDATSAG